jgi:ADP-ribose pyrophosphatase YjhB (NUDIX family)
MELNNLEGVTESMLNSYKNKASCIFIDNGTKVLGVSRKNNYSDFGLVGGKIENNESYVECIIRETKEETGLILNPEKIIPIFTGVGETGKLCKNNSECNCVCFYTQYYEGTINTNETGVVDWIDYNDLKKGSFHKYNTIVLEILKKNHYI